MIREAEVFTLGSSVNESEKAPGRNGADHAYGVCHLGDDGPYSAKRDRG